jgi:alpha-tubulin suppressor-like RCC1 family protein
MSRGLPNFCTAEGAATTVANHVWRTLGVDLSRLQLFVAEEFLHLVERHAALQESLGNGVAQQVGVDTLGNGTTTYSSMPVTVTGITNATAVAGGCYQTCAVLSGGSIQCWGWNLYGQLGNGSTTDSSVPVTVTGC